MLITIKHYDFIFNLQLNNKFTFIHDLSGKGKSFMAECLFEAHRDKDIKISSYINIQELPNVPADVKVVVLDEAVITFLQRRRLLVNFMKQQKKFLLITRLPLKCLNYSYKDIYTLQYKDNQYTLERKYADCNCLTSTPDYVEDSGAGFDYYKQFYSGIKSTHGKDNIINAASEGSTVIADGCSIGAIFRDLHYKYNLFLPESFEWLLLRKHDCVPDVSLENNSEDAYFKQRIKLPYKYTKDKLNPNYRNRKYMSDFEIGDSLLQEYLDNYGCGATVEDIRNLMYYITGDYTTEEVVKVAIVMYTLENLKYRKEV